MTRATVTRVARTVAAMTPVDDRHAASIEELLGALERLPRPLDEHADPTHLTASAIVVGPRGVVLHRHRRLGLWLQPGGHIDAGEDPADAAVRETVEETGLRVRHPADGPRLIHVDVHDGGRGHRHLDLRYLVVAGDEDPSPPEWESQDVRWFHVDEAVAMADPGLAGALRALSAGTWEAVLAECTGPPTG